MPNYVPILMYVIRMFIVVLYVFCVVVSNKICAFIDCIARRDAIRSMRAARIAYMYTHAYCAHKLNQKINVSFLVHLHNHADDIRTLASSIDGSIQQTDIQLCTEKCSLTLSRGKVAHSHLLANTNHLPVVDSDECLGTWWNAAPYSRESITEHITKARAAFFSHSQLGVFHGLLLIHSHLEILLKPA